MKRKSREVRRGRREESEFIVTGLSWFDSHSCSLLLKRPDPLQRPPSLNSSTFPPPPDPQFQNWVL